MEAETLANVIRGGTIESIHRGHFIIIDGDGETVASAGDPSTVTFFRSACKSLQAVPFLASGGADHFGFSEAEVALAVASHSGEPQHVKTAASMLAKIGLSESDLRCGAHLPFNEAEAQRLIAAGQKPTQLHNNCSGKHAAMLAFARHIGADITSYESPENPVQKAILNCVGDFCGIPADDISVGTDGCSAPNFAVPIEAMARSFTRLMSPPAEFAEDRRDACRRIVAAMMNYPELIGGTGRLDTMIMQAAPGKLISKVGADGVWLCGILPSAEWPSGLAIALKIEDGDDQLSRPVAAVDLLRHLRILSPDQLSDISPMPIKNRRGDTVGSIRACHNLEIR